MARIFAVVVGLIVPFVAIVALFPWYDRVQPMVLGFPFLYFWMFLWFPLTSICLYIAWRLENHQSTEMEDA